MGRKRLETSSRIENDYQRSITFCKRKRGVIKKLIELSNLCEQMIYLAVYDHEKRRLVTYSSEEAFGL